MRHNEVHDLFMARKAILELLAYTTLNLTLSEKNSLSEIVSKINNVESEVIKRSEDNSDILQALTNVEREKMLIKHFIDAHHAVSVVTNEILNTLAPITTDNLPFNHFISFLNKELDEEKKIAYLQMGAYCLIKTNEGYYLGYPDTCEFQVKLLTSESMLGRILESSTHLKFNDRVSVNYTVFLRVAKEVEKLGGVVPNLVQHLFQYVRLCVQLVHSNSVETIKQISEQGNRFHEADSQVSAELAALINVPFLHQHAAFAPLNALQWYDTGNNRLVEFGGVSGGMCHGFSVDSAERMVKNSPVRLFYVPSENIVKNQLIQKKYGIQTVLAKGYLDTLNLLKEIVKMLDADPQGIYLCQLRAEGGGGHEVVFRKLPNNLGYEYSESAHGIFYFDTPEKMITFVSLQCELTYRHRNFFITGATTQRYAEQPLEQSELIALVEKLRLLKSATVEENASAEKNIVEGIISHCQHMCVLVSKKLNTAAESDVRLFENKLASFKSVIIAVSPYLSLNALDRLFREIQKEHLGASPNILFLQCKMGESIQKLSALAQKEIFSDLRDACYQCHSVVQVSNAGLFSVSPLLKDEMQFLHCFKTAVLAASKKYLDYKKGQSRLTQALATIRDDRYNTLSEIMGALNNYFSPGLAEFSPNAGENTFSDFLLQEFVCCKSAEMDLFEMLSSKTNRKICAPENKVLTDSERKAFIAFFKFYNAASLVLSVA